MAVGEQVGDMSLAALSFFPARVSPRRLARPPVNVMAAGAPQSSLGGDTVTVTVVGPTFMPRPSTNRYTSCAADAETDTVSLAPGDPGVSEHATSLPPLHAPVRR